VRLEPALRSRYSDLATMWWMRPSNPLGAKFFSFLPKFKDRPPDQWLPGMKQPGWVLQLIPDLHRLGIAIDPWPPSGGYCNWSLTSIGWVLQLIPDLHRVGIAIDPWLHRVGIAIDPWPPSIAEDKNEWSCASTSLVFFYGVHRNYFTFIYPLFYSFHILGNMDIYHRKVSVYSMWHFG
jgi:hypothetical protein